MSIGTVEDVGLRGAVLRLDPEAIEALNDAADPATELAGTVGSQIKLRVHGLWLIGSIRSTRAAGDGSGQILADVDLLGEGDIGLADRLMDFRNGLTRYPRPGDLVEPVTSDDLAGLFANRGHASIGIGIVYPSSRVRASFNVDALLARHFALLGSTGSGKSTAAALIVHRVLETMPHARVVFIDPHGEYARAFEDKSEILNVESLALPWWLMNLEEHCEVFVTSEGNEREQSRAIMAKCLADARSKSVLAGAYRDLTVDTPVPYLMSDLLSGLQTLMGKLDNNSEVGRYVRLKNRIEEVLRDSRYSFMFNQRLIVDTMRPFLTRLLRLGRDGKPVSIIDLSGVPSDIVAVVVAVVSRIIMDHAIWSRGETQQPILLVCEEAHRYVPAERDTKFEAVRRSLERIAKEGRKYGVSLGLISQRPSDIAEGALSQCGTIIAMRLNNERDQACVGNAMSEGGRGFLDGIASLRQGECIVSGEGIALPARVQLDLQPAAQRPRSEDPSFSQLWSEPWDGAATLDRTIHRWRAQSETPPLDTGEVQDPLVRRTPGLFLDRTG